MSVSDGFIAFVRDLLADLGPLRFKRMFGGVGVYCDELFFAVGDDDVLYLKGDALNEAEFKAAGSVRFTYATRDGEVALRYWRLPESALDDPEEAVRWARLGLDAARRKAR